MTSSAVQMAHRVAGGTMTGRERFELRSRIGRRDRTALAERLARYCSPACDGCHRLGVAAPAVIVRGRSWFLCSECAECALASE